MGKFTTWWKETVLGHTPEQPEEPKEIELPKRFKHKREWFCACGARIAIRATTPRAEGAGNYVPGIQPGLLNWNGLLQERGWGTEPATCPACREGLTVAEYKVKKRLEAEGR